jgi:hypothetical protein
MDQLHRKFSAERTHDRARYGPRSPSTADLFEIMRTTRSMRRFRPDPVPNGLIRKILEAGVCAPSGGNMRIRMPFCRSDTRWAGSGSPPDCARRCRVWEPMGAALPESYLKLLSNPPDCRSHKNDSIVRSKFWMTTGFVM